MKKVKEMAAPTAEKNWEIKDRTYTLVSAKTPLTYMIQSRNIFYFDEERKTRRELKYTTNQTTPKTNLSQPKIF